MIVGPVELLGSGDVALVQAQTSILLASGAKSLMILAGAKTPLDQPAWDEMLQRLPVPVFGGVFPRVVCGRECVSAGVLVVGLNCTAEVCVTAGLDDPAPYFLNQAAHCDSLKGAETVLVWVDGLSRHVAAFIEALYDSLGSAPVYFGGGAGTLDLKPAPCLFSNRGVLQGAALSVGLPVRCGVGVAHGWDILEGPFLVSGAEGNVIHSLDYQPAATVYRAAVQPFADLPLEEGGFFEVAKNFPFGLERIDGSLIVRDPVRLEGESLVCVGEVPVQSSVYILRGEHASLIEAARTGCRQAIGQVGGAVSAALLIDCIGRILVLENRFDEELGAVNEALSEGGLNGLPVFGVLTRGEIASSDGGGLEFFNKTFVLGLLPDESA